MVRSVSVYVSDFFYFLRRITKRFLCCIQNRFDGNFELLLSFYYTASYVIRYDDKPSGNHFCQIICYDVAFLFFVCVSLVIPVFWLYTVIIWQPLAWLVWLIFFYYLIEFHFALFFPPYRLRDNTQSFATGYNGINPPKCNHNEVEIHWNAYSCLQIFPFRLPDSVCIFKQSLNLTD